MSDPKATHTGKLFDGLLDCYVLDDERRVVSQRGIVRVLSGRETGDLDRYIGRLPSRFDGLRAGPEISFSSPSGPARGREAQWVVDLLKAYDEADDADELHHTQRHLARNARKILRALAGVGIIALIDEATRYQEVRSAAALSFAFRAILTEQTRDWELLWDTHVVDPLCRLHGERFTGGTHPRWLASTYELKRRNPLPKHGTNHHQWLTPEARGVVSSQLHVVAALAETCGTKDEFWARLQHRYRKQPLQLTWLTPRRGEA